MTSQLESVGLETLSSGDNFSVRRLNCPFQLSPDRCVKFLGSCNGLVFVAHGDSDFHIWNPSTGFLKKLPGPDFTTLKPYVSSRIVNYYGVGYLSSTDDYKVVVACKMHFSSYIKDEVQVAIFSVRAHFWRRIESPPGLLNFCPGTLSNDALHWLKPLKYHEEIKIVAFDLAKEEFRNIGLPHFEEDGNSSTHLGVSDGGCLSVTRYGAIDSIDFWVLREYNVPESWTKLFNLNLSSPTDQWQRLRPILVTESSIIVNEWTTNGYMLIRIDHKGEKVGLQMSKGDWVRMIEYEESLLWIDR
jgi:F-box interacting protein